MSDTITTNGNAHNDVIAPLPIVLNEKFIEEHIQYKLEIKAIKKEQDIIKEKYIDTNYMDLKLENLENSMDLKLENLENSMDLKLENLENSMDLKLENLENSLERKFDEKFVTLERKFDDKFTEVDKTLTKMDAKISQSMLQMMFGTISAMGIFMTILFFLLQHYK